MDLIEARQFGAAQARHPWELARLTHVRRLIARHAALPDGSLACDIGCGDVFVAESLARAHASTSFYAIDSAFTEELLVAFTKREEAPPNLRLFESLERAESAATRPASLVLLMDVIEHIEDDVAFLKRLRSSSLVDRDTTVIITVPAAQSLFSAHDRILGHYRRYSTRRLHDAVRQSGMRVEETGAFFASLLVARAAQSLAERAGIASRQQEGVAGWQRGPIVTSWIANALRIDAAATDLLGRAGLRVPGLSIHAVCRASA